MEKTRKCYSCKDQKLYSEYSSAMAKSCNDCKNKIWTHIVCTRCKKEKSVADYNKSSTSITGFQGHCRQCASETGKEYHKTRPPRPEYNKKRYHEVLKNDPAYYEYKKQWRAENAEKIKEDAHQYYLENKLYLLANKQNERARKIGVPGIITFHDWKAILEFSGHVCLACGDSHQLSLDHVIPIGDFYGLNVIENIQPLCLKHNLKKGSRIVDFRTKEFNLFVQENCFGREMVS